MRAAWLALALVTLALAGCVGNDGKQNDDAPHDADGTDGDDVPAGGPDPRALPVWNVGDWWSYNVEFASGESYRARIVVHDEDGGNYLITPDDRELLLRAAFPHHPNFSPVAKADLSQTVHGEKVEHLRFPMANATWTATYRGAPTEYRVAEATLQTGKGSVEGFVTTIRNADDGRLRMSNGWSAEVKWYTNLTWDFDGHGPPEVTYTLNEWGSDAAGTFPVLTVRDLVHRPFPTIGVPTPDPADPPGLPPDDLPEATEAVAISEGSSLLWGMFAVAGGNGLFRAQIGHESSGAYEVMEWQPSAADEHFAWAMVESPDPGQWGLSAGGAAQEWAFLFVEAFEIVAGEVTL
jgi:hypothetical protein